MEISNTKQSVVNALLGKTVVLVSRIAIEENEDCDVLTDTLVFTLADGSKFELLTQQAKTVFKEISSDNNLFVDFELEPNEILKTYPIEPETFNLPFTVDSATDIWASEEDTKFLVAIILWDIDKRTVLPICTETDEIELMTIDKLRQRIDRMVFAYGCVEQKWYKEKILQVS
ncbi:hypothetical protein NIES267_10180 [Calothrix parasitica NIES-267]|uniref:Uncharacterized protein n=1 Tax=Calothrix parasitica NIES-267 TaxID=1973488 RepID=A0A1Z4LJY4_9CYAN|nr:hypothetical protein NIES267_10180 [Calothrix parasitica NIES-267]